jgi:hypothetical protein
VGFDDQLGIFNFIGDRPGFTFNEVVIKALKGANVKITLLILILFLTQTGSSCTGKLFGSKAKTDYSSMNKEEASKKIISDLFDSCQAGKNAEVAELFSQITPDREKQRLKKDKFDYSNPEDQKRIDRECQGINGKYGKGYEFGKVLTQGEVVGWEVYPKGAAEGQIFAFKLENGKYVLVDIDPVKR